MTGSDLIERYGLDDIEHAIRSRIISPRQLEAVALELIRRGRQDE